MHMANNAKTSELGRDTERSKTLNGQTIADNTVDTINEHKGNTLITDREFGYIPLVPRKLINLPVNNNIVFKNSAHWLQQIHAAVSKYSGPFRFEHTCLEKYFTKL